MTISKCSGCQGVLEPGSLTCPQCGAEQQEKHAQEHWARGLGRIAGWSKWLTTTLVACGYFGLASMAGYSPQAALWGLALAFSVLVAGWFAMRLHRQYRMHHPLPEQPAGGLGEKPSRSARKEKAKTAIPEQISFMGGLGIGLGLAVGGMVLSHFGPNMDNKESTWRTEHRLNEAQRKLLSPQGTDSSRSNQELQNGLKDLQDRLQDLHQKKLRAEKTAAYWNATVYTIFRPKFAELPENADVYAASEEKTRQLADVIQLAKSESTKDVDPELVELVRSQIEFDEAALSLMDDFRKDPAFQTPVPGTPEAQKTVREAMELIQKVKTLGDSQESGELPEHIQQFLEFLTLYEETNAEHYREIEIMQARLSERYPAFTFSLPSLDVSLQNETD